MLHNGHELHVAAPDAFEELIRFESASLAHLVDGGHGVEFDPGAAHKGYGVHYLSESGESALVLAAAVVYVFRPVD